uniref:Integrase zinc-binding domain-containing protein n=1 Tax=Ananas comosus var. bracteatus TaxID=296719 RepID=A0A6V7PPJ4_ANACO|nr:unnamed protein product [Ananas comosus var. bracteatus]
MYKDLKLLHWWPEMKKDVGEFVARCLTCQRMKTDHSAGKLQSLSIPVWKWKKITMDFVMGLSHSQAGHDTIWVIVDRLTKSAHFISIHTTWTSVRYRDSTILANFGQMGQSGRFERFGPVPFGIPTSLEEQK